MTTRLIRTLPVAALLAASLAAPAMAAVINGGSGPDVLVGTPTADTIRGFGGNDVLRGSGGADHLYGGHGADRIYGGREVRRDRLYGGAGPDHIYTHTSDTAYAGYGNDTVEIFGPDKFGQVDIFCGPGHDTVIIRRAGEFPWVNVDNCEHVR